MKFNKKRIVKKSLKRCDINHPETSYKIKNKSTVILIPGFQSYIIAKGSL